MSTIWMTASVVVAMATIGIAGLLFALYRRIYTQRKTSFGLALLVFAGAFVIQSSLTVYSYLVMMPLIPESLMPYLFVTGLCEGTGLTAVVWTASR
jgi:multisubunit Na+/H+ antiporter MnhB subunit